MNVFPGFDRGMGRGAGVRKIGFHEHGFQSGQGEEFRHLQPRKAGIGVSRVFFRPGQGHHLEVILQPAQGRHFPGGMPMLGADLGNADAAVRGRSEARRGSQGKGSAGVEKLAAGWIHGGGYRGVRNQASTPGMRDAAFCTPVRRSRRPLVSK